jgi:phosphoenolpyruvate carboxykinase (ATP)
MSTQAKIYTNLSTAELIDHAIANNEGKLCANGSFVTETGKRTGRSPKDRFLVCDDITRDTVDWGMVNRPIDPEPAQKLWDKAEEFIKDKTHYVSDFQVGATAEHAIGVTVRTQYAWHNLFARHLFIRELNTTEKSEQWQILNVPHMKTDPAIDGVHGDGTVIIDFSNKRVLLAGMRYAGENKKAMFTVQNFWLPQQDVLPMHCSANLGDDNDVALFFGLSGTGKTTLSADPSRQLIGDDEHGWSADGVFNLEGGCYAKCINLSKENEPLIWDAIRAGTVLENVVVDSAGNPDYSDSTLSTNSRAAYPRDFIPNCNADNAAGNPHAVVFLTCDLYGVLPPVAKLSTDQAAYYFLSGYTALVGSTEVGSTSDIQSTFSTCFGAPFFPRPATVYAELLIKRLRETGAQVYLVNTGWTGGEYGSGQRFSIPTTRAIIDSILDGSAKSAPTTKLDGFNFDVPTALDGVDSDLLIPRNTWDDKDAYDQKRKMLINLFKENFKKYEVSDAIKSAGPVET